MFKHGLMFSFFLAMFAFVAVRSSDQELLYFAASTILVFPIISFFVEKRLWLHASHGQYHSQLGPRS